MNSKMNFYQFQKMFPNNRACLDYLVKKCECGGSFKYVQNKVYACRRCKNKLYPTSGTIFHKPSTPMVKWFYAIYLFSASKHGVSAKELQRHLGVTYKTAWRIGYLIRSKMKQERTKLEGVVEVDETYFGGKHYRKYKFSKKTPILGMVQRGGQIRVKRIPAAQTHILLNNIKTNISKKAILITDENKIYKKTPKLGYNHAFIKHGKRNYVRGNIYTNTIEGFWSIFKCGTRGTYRFISRKHLQKYLDEFAFRYNHRNDAFEVLLERLKP